MDFYRFWLSRHGSSGRPTRVNAKQIEVEWVPAFSGVKDILRLRCLKHPGDTQADPDSESGDQHANTTGLIILTRVMKYSISCLCLNHDINLHTHTLTRTDTHTHAPIRQERWNNIEKGFHSLIQRKLEMFSVHVANLCVFVCSCVSGGGVLQSSDADKVTAGRKGKQMLPITELRSPAAMQWHCNEFHFFSLDRKSVV